MRTYAYLLAPDNVADPKAEVSRVAADRAKYSGEYFHVVGIKSFYDAGANVVFHSDYPVSPIMNVKYSIYTAEKRTYPQALYGVP